MNSLQSRINQVLTHASTILGYMAICIALTSIFLTVGADDIDISFKVNDVKKMYILFKI
jgi:hypothetical protein